MADVTGALHAKAGGKEYTLWAGMTALATLQEKHGQDVFQKLERPSDAAPGWTPPLRVFVDLVLASLRRHHPDADEWTVDDLIAENRDLFPRLMAAAFPDAEGKAKGNGKRAAS